MRVLRAAKTLSYWKSNQDRVRSQMLVNCSQDKDQDDDAYAIIPMVVPAGTLTRRAVERTWLTASNAKEDRIGSELKSMIQAPPGFVFVGADVDRCGLKRTLFCLLFNDKNHCKQGFFFIFNTHASILLLI